MNNAPIGFIRYDELLHLLTALLLARPDFYEPIVIIAASRGLAEWLPRPQPAINIEAQKTIAPVSQDTAKACSSP